MSDSPVTRYIIVGPARSGTTVTHLCLAGHPNVSALSDEVKVHPFFTQGISTFTHGNDRENECRAGFLALFDTLCTLNRPGEMLACGLKTAISSCAEAAEFVQSVQANFPEVKIILTLREDIVAQLGSLERARITGNWHSWVKPKQRFAGKLQLSRSKLQRHALDYLLIEKNLLGLGKTHDVTIVSYENGILPGIEGVYRSLANHLRLPELKPTWLNSQKVAPPPEDYIEDYHSHSEFVRQLRKDFENSPDAFWNSDETLCSKSGVLGKIRGWLPF